MSVEPGVLVAHLDVAPLGSIAPSHFAGLRECALREVWLANRRPQLLPRAPAAVLGTVAHRLLEEAGRGEFGSSGADAIDERWDVLIRSAEDDASRNWLERHLTPFSASVPDFEVRRISAISTAKALAVAAGSACAEGDGRSSDQRSLLGYEVRLATPDNTVTGRIDAVEFSDGDLVLRDYKSGAIFAAGSVSEINADHAIQLKIYAAVYQAMTGNWPARLEVVPIGSRAIPVPFTREECVDLLDEVRGTRERVNGVVSSDESLEHIVATLANPSPTACAFCAFRPQCAPYLAVRDREMDPEGHWPSDVRGELSRIQVLGNGRLYIEVRTKNGTAAVRNVNASAHRHPALALASVGSDCSVFNLRTNGRSESLSEGPLTVIYR